jgi:hypothetical protein
MTQLLGFLPDVDAATPGALTDCANVVPGPRGMTAAPSAVSVVGVPALAAECRNAAIGTKLDGTRRIFGGTAAKLYELSAGAWSDVSRGANYTLGADDRWDFAQFGDATLAVNSSCVVQRSNGSGVFADIATAPQAKCLETAAGFVVAFNTNAGADYWHCCALLNETDWTLSVSTQATSGRLVSTPGAITAAKAFGDQIVVYKDRSMYLGRYVGTPSVWQWDLIPGDVGCIGVDAVTDLGGAGHVFVARSDIMMFDGTRPVSIAEGSVRQWFFNNVSQQYIYKTQTLHDKQNGVVWIFYPSTSSTVCDQALVYHLGTKQWGRVTQTIECALNYVSAGATIDGLGSYSSTIDGLPAVSLDSQYWLSGGRMLTVMTSAHQLSTLTGIPSASSMTLFEVGDDEVVTRLTRLRVGYQSAPTSATVSGSAKMSRGEAYAPGGSGIYSAGKFDMQQSGRFHRAKVDAVGAWAAAVVDFDLSGAGKR